MITFYRVVVISVFLLLSSCATQTFLVNSSDKASESELDLDNPSSFFVSGIGQQEIIKAAEVCGGADKVGKVETETTVLNWFLGLISLGIYTPVQHRVYCINDRL